MVRFPSPEEHGEGVIVEVLGPRGQPGVDTLSVIRAYNLPDEFPEDAKTEAREAASAFSEDDLDGREDFTAAVVVTIDPADARDFDDAVSVTRDEATGHWQLTVHIADVGHFAPSGGALDREARKRATSVYLPQRVLPMFPEVISNHLASLQEGRLRYVKSVVVDLTPEGQKTSVRFANGAIRVRKRFTYEQVLAHLEAEAPPKADALEPDIYALLSRMRELAMLLRDRRAERGALELNMPEAELEYDDQGRVSGAHFRKDDVSHQIIEEFMLTANESVAELLARLDATFLRRVHPDPDPLKQESFAGFARSLGYKMDRSMDRLALQRNSCALGRQARSLCRPLRLVAQPETSRIQPRRRGPLRASQRRLLPLYLSDSSLSRSDNSSPIRTVLAHRQGWRQHNGVDGARRTLQQNGTAGGGGGTRVGEAEAANVFERTHRHGDGSGHYWRGRLRLFRASGETTGRRHGPCQYAGRRLLLLRRGGA